MEFTTKIPIPKSNHPIDYHSNILSLGSCFAENMGEKFQYFKFQVTTNPFGIIFNPVSIENLIARAANKQQFTDNDVFFHNELWHCFEVHSDLSSVTKEELLENLNQRIDSLHYQITHSTHCIMTYGTSWVYRHKKTNQIVANCHKVPQNQFDKVILSIVTVQESISNTMQLIQKINPNCHFMFTVSPVRHLKDGFVENQRSKAHLIAAIHTIPSVELGTHTYFPSYEIMMDELRDYRFYAQDMLHPNAVAVDYIWERFIEATIAPKVYSVMKEVETIQKGLAHKPFNPLTENHQKFHHNLQQQIKELTLRFPQFQF